MSLCAFCGYPTLDDGMCAYHGVGQGAPDLDDWASGNRIMCDFIHRGILLERRATEMRQALDLAEPLLV